MRLPSVAGTPMTPSDRATEPWLARGVDLVGYEGHDASRVSSEAGRPSGSECSTFSGSCGARTPARTASSWAATAPP